MKKIVITCDKCKSKNVISQEERYDVVKEKVKSFNLDHEWWETKSYKIKWNCKCSDCGHVFTEY